MTQPGPDLATKAARTDVPDLTAPVDREGVTTYEAHFKSDPMDVRNVLTDLEKSLTSQNLRGETIADMTMVLAEVLNNVVEHAHMNRRDGTIHLNVLARLCCVRCQIVDDGRAMPGLELPIGLLPTHETDLQDLPEGGFGWFLIRNLTTDLTYQRRDGENRLQFNLPFADAS